ncbi:MAG TPA: tetratricopeptide repeat protein [Sedimentisphaerales bacterium]|jgi:tetratricopeptide (TPR) repeat protein|nr:tetratricopeptide repeat protein [Sedimentisphaerales bacterium]HNU31773.1 tetratricopeptide repeat protein [Sedimentisphaerales bacterium]
MKSDHRHELKTNELADWLANFPEWAKQNRKNLTVAGVVVVAAILVYIVSHYWVGVAGARNRERLTRLVSQVPEQINTVMRSAAQGTDQSYTLMPIAQDLQDFADGLSNNDMAALALIKRGEALRAELHLRLTDPTKDDLAAQIGKAKASYQAALDRKPSNPALAAAAQFGLGLCEEELGNFGQAADVYRTTAQKPEYAGTVAQAAAEYRLKIMDDFKTQVVFKPAPAEPQATTPTIQIPGTAASDPTAIPVPSEPMIGPVAPTTPAVATPETPAATTPPAAGDANQPAGG